MHFDGISRLNPDPPEFAWGIGSLAFLEGVSLITVDAYAIERVETGDLPERFDAFCEAAARDLDGFRQRMRSDVEPCFRSQWINAPPLARLLRCHSLWSWFELCQVIRTASRSHSPMTVRMGDDLSGLDFTYAEIARLGPRVLVSGPARVRGEEHDVQTAMEVFNRLIGFWRRPDNDDAGGPLFTIEQLMRHAGTRRSFSDDAAGQQPDPRPFARALEILERRSTTHRSLASLARTALLISTESALINFGDDADQRTALENAFPAVFLPQNGEHPRSIVAVKPPLLGFLRHREQTGLLAWTQYFYESTLLFSEWLARSSYLSIAPRAFSGSENSKRTWNEACRFLGNVLYCAEVTIYRYCVGERGRPLKAVASYLERVAADDEHAGRAASMAAVACDPLIRAHSICYRAADSNKAEYVPSTRAVSEAIIPAPMANGDCARSVLAMPIRLNGGVWGVLEFVSVREHHFGPLLRSKCEEMASAMESQFLLANIFETLGKLEGYWSDTFTEDRGRRGELCFALSSIFICDALAVYIASRDEDGTVFGLERFGAWSSVEEKDTRAADDLVTIEVRDFLEGAEPVVEIVATHNEEQTLHRKTFIVRMLPHASMRWAGALVFSIPYPIRVDAAWRQTTFALGQIIAGVVSNVSSDASWNKEARRDLRHEYLWMLDSLRGATSRLAGLSTRVLPLLDLNDRRGVERVPKDLDDVANSLESLSDALLADVYDRHTLGDRRLIAVRKAQERYRQGPQDAVSLREVFYSRFRTAVGAFPKQRLKLQVNPLVQERLVHMPHETLGAIMGTLADNAVKYSVPGGEIIMTFGEGGYGTFLARISSLGPALSPDEVKHIFEDGFRGKAARLLQPSRGSGLGLKYARGAIELWDGSLEYDFSKPSSPITTVDKQNVVWHRFTLVFPRHLVAERADREKLSG